MDTRINVVDVSSFVLFEATGDSQADYDIKVDEISEEMGMAEDDAQSCSCNLTDNNGHSNGFDDLADSVSNYGCVSDEGEEEEECWEEESSDEEEGQVVDQGWSRRKLVAQPSTCSGFSVMAAGKQKKSGVCVDSVAELMTEREKDRLFWETCLAS